MNNRKAIYFTSDWHVGHYNVLKFDERPFKDLDHMHRVLVNNYNACVPKDGICYFLGDMGLCSSEKLEKIIRELNGVKVLCLGNHDKGLNAMYQMGFDVVVHGLKLEIAGEIVTASHCPLKGIFREDTTGMSNTDISENWHGENRPKHQKLSFDNTGQFHLHGHIHWRPGRTNSNKIEGKQFDVGVPGNDYRPVNISVIESWIAKTKEKTNDTSEISRKKS